MNKTLSRLACAAVLAVSCQMFAGAAVAQQPSAAAIAVAKDLLEAKGAGDMFDPIIIRMVEQTKGALLQTNPQLSKDLNDVGLLLSKELAPRRAELINEAAKFYAQRFTEQELKEIVNFFRTNVGKKMIAQEPLVLDDTFNYIQQQWGPRVSEEVMNRFRAEMKKKGHTL